MIFSSNNRFSLRRRIIVGSTLLALVGLTAVGSMSCVTLEDIEPNLCGNRVVEPDIGEACDSATTEPNTACGGATEYGACRYICEYGATDDAAIRCPTGQGCGLDGICRKSGGIESTGISIAGGGTRQLMSGDFDGDGRNDVVAINDSAVDIIFLTADGYVDDTLTVPNDQGIPGIGDIDGDGLSDIALNMSNSIGVLLGQEDRSLIPQTFPTAVAETNTSRLVPLGSYATDNAMLAFSQTAANEIKIQSIILHSDGGHQREDVGVPIPGSLVGVVGVTSMLVPGQTDKCPVVAFEVSKSQPGGKDRLYALGCSGIMLDPESTFVNSAPWAGAHFADVDQDGDDDLIFGQILIGSKSLQVRKNDGAGNFAPPTLLLGVEDDACAPDKGVLSSEPLAIGDINLDGYPDYVDSRGILLYTPTAYQRICNQSSRWAQALIGDINGDGLRDIVAARQNEAVIDVWHTLAEGNFNTFTVAVDGPIGELVGGDFDGDMVFDVAYRFGVAGENTDGPSPGEIFAMFGEPLAVPSKPVPLGFIDNPINLVAGRIKGENAVGLPDTLSDLLILSRSDDDNDPMTDRISALTLIQGNATRNLVSPLALKPDTTVENQPLVPDGVLGLVVSRFGSGYCRMPLPPNDDTTIARTPSPITALSSTAKIWLAGCKKNGSSTEVLDAQVDALQLQKSSFLFAPVNKNATTDSLALFLQLSSNETALGILDYDGMQFNTGPNWLGTTAASLRLPARGSIDVPFAYLDVDKNQRWDVVLTGTSSTDPSKGAIFIFWNVDTNASGTLDATDFSELQIDVTPTGMMGPMDSSVIIDVAVLNLDGDPYKEIVVLASDGLHFAKLQTDPATEESDVPALHLPRTLIPYDPTTEDGDALGMALVRNANALLAIDANSDGIEDLVVADPRKLQLFLGKERF